MLYDTWLYIKPADWNAVNTSILSSSALSMYEQAITGFWDTYSTGYEVYNILGTKSDIDELKLQFTDVARDFRWIQGSGLDAYDDADNFITIPSEVLAVQKDLEGGGSATYEAPNWGHVFFGQSERVFAGEFSDEFSTEFF